MMHLPFYFQLLFDMFRPFSTHAILLLHFSFPYPMKINGDFKAKSKFASTLLSLSPTLSIFCLLYFATKCATPSAFLKQWLFFHFSPSLLPFFLVNFYFYQLFASILLGSFLFICSNCLLPFFLVLFYLYLLFASILLSSFLFTPIVSFHSAWLFFI